MTITGLPSCRSPHLLFFYYFLFLAVHSPITTAGPIQCDDSAGNYTSNGTFQANLGLLLASLSANTPATHYFNDTKGRSPDQVFGHAMCRGDLSAADCRTWVARAAQDVVNRCPNRKAATAWYDDTCLVRYAGESFFGSPSGTQFIVFRTDNVADQQLAKFNQQLGELMDGLAARAAHRSPRKFAVGEVNFTSFSKIYGMAQCTRDLAADACDGCLRGEISDIDTNCNGKKGCTFLGRSCLIRYNVAPFYDAAAAADSPPPTQPLAQAPSSGTTSTSNTSSGTTVADKTTKSKIALAIAIPTLVVLAFICLIFTWFWRKKQKPKLHNGADEAEIKTEEFLVFDLETLKAATNNFSDANKLGEGGFGRVYKGMLLDGQEIAVKRLSTSSRQGLPELRNEVFLVAKLHHRNLVKLLGCCLEVEKLLVYEFLPNKSLDRFLFDSARCKQLNWETRYKIIGGIARGLQYLHEDSRLKVIHRDLKASNILLDEDMNPKISDFGLAKLFGQDQSEGDASRVAGTFGYMAPEYVINRHISTKSDVYSFGVLVLEIVTGRKCTKIHNSRHPMDLTSYVKQHWVKGDVFHVLDRGLVEGCSMEEARKCIHIGLLCAHDDPYVRPNMSTVVLMLSNQTMTLPSISIVDGGTTTEGNASTRDQERSHGDASHRRSMSKNSMSMTTLEPR